MDKILIIEDDEAIAKIKQDFLMINGYETKVADNGTLGMQEALSNSYDLILLDLMLPDIDGLEICKQLRESLSIPILMVTAKVEDVDKIMGLGVGADDYITKPFSAMELVARVKANLAQHARMTQKDQADLSEVIDYGKLKLNTKTRRVLVDDVEVEFKNREYELLLFLMANPEVVFTRESLYEKIWGLDAIGDSRTVAVHLSRLREKIEKDPANPEHIQTVWGAGYRFRP